MRFSQLTGLLVLVVGAWAGFVFTKSIGHNKFGGQTIKLELGPTLFGPPDIWDPPLIVKLLPDGKRVILGKTLPPDKLPPELTEVLLLYPFDSRGVTLLVDPETSLQKVVNFLDQLEVESQLVISESQRKFGTPGKPVKARIYFYSDTLQTWLPHEPPPPISPLTQRPNPSFNRTQQPVSNSSFNRFAFSAPSSLRLAVGPVNSFR